MVSFVIFYHNTDLFTTISFRSEMFIKARENFGVFMCGYVDNVS